MTGLLLVLLAVQAPLDEATLVVREDTVEVARESFRFVRGRGGGADSPAWTLATSIRYERKRPMLVLAPILDVTSDSQPVSLEYDVASVIAPARILGQLSRGRFTVRTLGHSTERAREIPVTGRFLVLDDSVYALYLFAAWAAGPAPVTLTAVVPRSSRRDTLTVQDRGQESTSLLHGAVMLRHVTVTGGPNGQVDLWLDEGGRLLKVEIPSRRVRVERQPPA
ncbi:MAG TPA: hypothetical protein VLV16_11160 [Gemmatimonadales bacterium]|nr:hypothetical protein [Gemmatimonadales bacterium]